MRAGPLWWDQSPYDKRHQRDLTLSTCMNQGKTMWALTKNAAICKPEREPPPGTKSARTLILESQPPGWWELNVDYLSHKIYSSLSWQPAQMKTHTRFNCLQRHSNLLTRRSSGPPWVRSWSFSGPQLQSRKGNYSNDNFLKCLVLTASIMKSFNKQQRQTS